MASKAAYLSALIDNEIFEIRHYKASEELKDMLIINPLYNKLNGLKRNNPEAFYYWFHTINLK